jgi:hypothetical protein
MLSRTHPGPHHKTPVDILLIGQMSVTQRNAKTEIFITSGTTRSMAELPFVTRRIDVDPGFFTRSTVRPCLSK